MGGDRSGVETWLVRLTIIMGMGWGAGVWCVCGRGVGGEVLQRTKTESGRGRGRRQKWSRNLVNEVKTARTGSGTVVVVYRIVILIVM